MALVGLFRKEKTEMSLRRFDAGIITSSKGRTCADFVACGGGSEDSWRMGWGHATGWMTALLALPLTACVPVGAVASAARRSTARRSDLHRTVSFSRSPALRQAAGSPRTSARRRNARRLQHAATATLRYWYRTRASAPPSPLESPCPCEMRAGSSSLTARVSPSPGEAAAERPTLRPDRILRDRRRHTWYR